jgi:alpha-tubulin suppressor-like RCC1 family protein
MTLLHVYFKLRNFQAFKIALQSEASPSDRAQSGSVPSSSGGRSWHKPNPLSSLSATNGVNARDSFGCTVLHLACASIDPQDLEYVRLLLTHPMIGVNLHDLENHWTALHRAMYNGNIPATLLLLKRQDIDYTIKDLEGYTAFDLYNSTLDDTKPSGHGSITYADLYTWGTNSNYTLGLGDGDDRAYPEHVPLLQDVIPSTFPIELRFQTHRVSRTVMSRLHTVVTTSETPPNIRLCGFGSGGRLGPGQHTQCNLTPLQQFSHKVDSVALGQDHTLVLTSTGEVFSWGLNRFSQLGYVVETTTQGRLEEPIQVTPRKILGPLRKDIFVCGVAASKVSSACWTSQEVFTWGTNNGHLGYDKTTAATQVLPRKVAKLEQPVISVTLTDFGMACLLLSRDVVLFWNDRHFKINFPANTFPAEMTVYRPMRASTDSRIEKVISSENNMAALSVNGELFMFNVPDPSSSEVTTSKERASIKAARVWALRKQFSAVKDAALGADGSVIICTDSGHVFVRSRRAQGTGPMSGKTLRFQRIPYIQRVIAVCASSAGAFGAHRLDFTPRPIQIQGNTIAEDLALMQPYLSMLDSPTNPFTSPRTTMPKATLGDFDAEDAVDLEDETILQDIDSLRKLFQLLSKSTLHKSNTEGIRQAAEKYGADVLVQLVDGEHVAPCHRVILSSRSPVFRELLLGLTKGKAAQSGISMFLSHAEISGLPRLVINGAHPITVLILLFYLYSDRLLAIWDRRLAQPLETELYGANIRPDDVRISLQELSRVLRLRNLSEALQFHVKTVPMASMSQDMASLNTEAQTKATLSKLLPDVALQFKDQRVACHSIILRARSPFFHDFLGDRDWLEKRRDPKGIVTVDMQHLEWRVMSYVLRFLSYGEENLFTVVDTVESVDDLIELVFDVMAAANELLLDRLTEICSAVILHHLSIHNACFVLADSVHLNAKQLSNRVQQYIAVNLELFLQCGLLDDVPIILTKQLSKFVRGMQISKAPQSRGEKLAFTALQKHSDWLAVEDFPQPLVPSGRCRKESTKASPKTSRVQVSTSTTDVLPPSPSMRPQRGIRPQPSTDDLFVMEDDIPQSAPNKLRKNSLESLSPSKPRWGQVSSIPKLGMSEIMAETARQKSTRLKGASSSEQLLLTPTRRPPLSEPVSSGSPSWRKPSMPQVRPLIQTPSGTPPSSTRMVTVDPNAFPRPGTNRLSSGASSASVLQSTPPRATVAGLGPVYSPTKQRASSSQQEPLSGSSRRVL